MIRSKVTLFFKPRYAWVVSVHQNNNVTYHHFEFHFYVLTLTDIVPLDEWKHLNLETWNVMSNNTSRWVERSKYRLNSCIFYRMSRQKLPLDEFKHLMSFLTTCNYRSKVMKNVVITWVETRGNNPLSRPSELKNIYDCTIFWIFQNRLIYHISYIH
jgi:hypothetical protein